jgi:PAS domain S-box-containing protein
MSVALRALLVEDSESDSKLIEHALRRALGAVQCRRVETAEDVEDALATEPWDVIICDWSMPVLNAPKVIEILKESGKDIPLIIASGTVGEETAVKAMRAGARDYVLKEKLVRLAPVVEREVRESRQRQERRHSEEALRISEARFARLAESGIVGIAIADLHGGILEANDAYLKIVGYTREELLSGKVSWADMTPPDFRAEAVRAVESLRKFGTAPPWETEQIRKDGVHVPVMVAVAMLDHPKCIAIVTDLTERKRTELALRRTEEQLRHIQKMEAIGILAGGVAHDFNNLLSIILGYCGMLMEQLDPANPMRADIVEINSAGERGAALTRRLLAFSRQQVVETMTLNLNEVIMGLDSMLRRLIRADIELDVLPEPGLGRCKADAGQIEQIVMNLAVNAIDAMPDGGRLVIETANADLDDEYVVSHVGMKAGQYVMIAISDTGVGMSAEVRARIFEPFFTTKAKGKGTGLGLATVFGIVQQSGGTVQVYSELGRGTTFKVYLPRSDDVPVADTARTNVDVSRGAESILLVEDEDALRKVTASILGRSGYRVLEACNGTEALRILELDGNSVDLLLTDVVMPQMNGRQLSERVSTLRPDIRVLYMSGYTDGILVGQLAAGALLLQKPFTPSVLTRKVRDALDSTAHR